MPIDDDDDAIAQALNRIADALYEIAHALSTEEVGEALKGLAQIRWTTFTMDDEHLKSIADALHNRNDIERDRRP